VADAAIPDSHRLRDRYTHLLACRSSVLLEVDADELRHAPLLHVPALPEARDSGAAALPLGVIHKAEQPGLGHSIYIDQVQSRADEGDYAPREHRSLLRTHRRW
jgi:hypothetical protein